MGRRDTQRGQNEIFSKFRYGDGADFRRAGASGVAEIGTIFERGAARCSARQDEISSKFRYGEELDFRR